MMKTDYKKIIVFTTSGWSKEVAHTLNLTFTARCNASLSLHEKENAMYRLAGDEVSRWKWNVDSVVCRSL